MAEILDVEETLVKALEESNGKTRDIILDNELPGITQEMYEWWSKSMGETRLYKKWHPDHVSFEREETGNPASPFIAHPTEKLGKYGPSTMNFMPGDPNKYPLEPKYKNYRHTIHLSSDGRQLSFLCGEYEQGPNGLKIRQIFRWPEKTPQDLVDALVKHVTEEVQNFPKFLPELYAEEGNK